MLLRPRSQLANFASRKLSSFRTSRIGSMDLFRRPLLLAMVACIAGRDFHFLPLRADWPAGRAGGRPLGDVTKHGGSRRPASVELRTSRGESVIWTLRAARAMP